MAAVKKPSGPSGEHLVPKRTIRVPDELWEELGRVAQGNRNAVINELIEGFIDQHRRVET